MYGPQAANISATNSGTSEAVVGTTPALPDVAVGGDGYVVSGTLVFTGNAAASTCTVKVRRDSVSGTSVYSSGAITVAAAAVVAIPFTCIDQGASGTGVSQYVVTQTNSAAAGNSGAIAGCITVTPSEMNS